MADMSFHFFRNNIPTFIFSKTLCYIDMNTNKLFVQYDSLKIKQLTFHGIENDPAKIKNDANKLEALKKEIK